MKERVETQTEIENDRNKEREEDNAKDTERIKQQRKKEVGNERIIKMNNRNREKGEDKDRKWEK